MNKNKKEYIQSLKGFIKRNPTLYGLNTKDFKDFLIDLANIESTYRKDVKGRTADGKLSGYNGYYAMPISSKASANKQHKEAFRIISELLKHVIVQEDIDKAKELGISESQLLAKVWNQRNRVLNYLYNGIDTSDGNGVKVSEYGTSNKTAPMNANLRIRTYTKPAITDDYYEVQKGDTFSTIQERVRTPGRDYNTEGDDLLQGVHNRTLNTDKLRIGTPIKTKVDTPTEHLLGLDKFDRVKNAPKIPMKRYGGRVYGWGGLDRDSYALEAINKGYYRDLDMGHSVDYYLNERNYNPNYLRAGYDEVQGYMEQFVFDYAPDGTIVGSHTELQPLSITHYKNPNELSKGDYYNHKRDGKGYNSLVYLTNQGIQYYKNVEQNALNIFDNMNDRIDSDIAQNRQLARTTAKYGALIPRRRFNIGGLNYAQSPYSGYIGWGTKVKPDNIARSRYNADGEGIYGKNIANYASIGASTGLGLGTTIGLATGAGGAAAGAAAGAWAGPIGLLAGAGLGALIGWLVGDNEKDDIEQQRKEQLAQADEMNRQQTISNMQYRHENDVAKIRNYNSGISSFNNSFYGKFGGMLCRRKLEYGGHIIPNSSNTSVAYGRTHDQINPQTGMTGVTYGDAEVEGGGFVNGREYAGEVIRNTSNGDQIYSDSLYVPGTRATYAQVAKQLTDKKGILEKDIQMRKDAIDTALDSFAKVKLSKAKAGTATRNIEKEATLLNRKVGELAEIEQKLDETFATQEVVATGLGLRNGQYPTAKFGGYRPKYAFGYNEAGLLGNTLIAGLNILGNELTGKYNKAQLEFMRSLKTPKRGHVEAEYYNTDYDISNDIALAATQYNRNRRFIVDNSSNAKVARNAIRQSDIDFLSQVNTLRDKQKKYQAERYDLNRNARVQARNLNRQIDYENLVADYNRDMSYYQGLTAIENQMQQGRMTALAQLGQALQSYGQTKIYEGMWEPGVREDMQGIKTLTEKTTMKNRKGIEIKNKKGNVIELPKGTKIQNTMFGMMYQDAQGRWIPIRRYVAATA